MKIVIANDNQFAHFYERQSWAKVLKFAQYDVYFWNIQQKNVFDIFDEIKPDVIFLQGYNLTPGTIQCIKENPQTKLVIRVSDFSKWNNELDKTKYPVLTASDTEKQYLQKIQQFPNDLILHTHHHPNWLEQTHGLWQQNGFRVISIMNCADLFSYSNGKYFPNLECDIAFIGGYWPYKAIKLDKWILPLTESKYRTRIFGNQPWPTSSYCGFIQEDIVRHVLKSSKICPCVHESHSTEFGYDVISRPFNLLANKCFCVSDDVAGLKLLFPNQISYASTPEIFQEKIAYYMKNDDKREKLTRSGFEAVIKEHTAFDRMISVFKELNLSTDQIELAKTKFLTHLENTNG